jgi:thioredoxin-dependent adenylylsulfate APS reductase
MMGFESWDAREVLAWAIERYGDGFAVGTSFQKEGIIITDMAWRIRADVRVFTLDTGRLPEETHAMIDAVRERYGIAVEVVSPDPDDVAAMVAAHGSNLFYRDRTLRALCCEVRKVGPLARKLRTLSAWATGLRREQGGTRAGVEKVDVSGATVKLSPLADWTEAQVEEYTRANGLPVHPLYARGYTSIGCAPCTRATAAGEDERAGRWWWERDSTKECGIHFAADGRVEREKRA